MKKNNSLKMNKLLILGIIFLFGAIIVQLSHITLFTKVDGVNLTEFDNNRIKTKETLRAGRGTIYDVNGSILAKNVNSYTVIAYLSASRTTNPKNPEHVVNKEETAEKLAPIINMSKEDILALLNWNTYQVELGPGGRGITELKKEEIEKLDLPGIGFIRSTKRYYNMNNFASSIIGYARKDDNENINGEMGIEKQFNAELCGIDGYKEYQRDAYGYQIPNTPSLTKAPVNGQDVYLTIDNNIQLILENVVTNLTNNYDMDWVTISVMEAKTGRIVGSATNMGFNLNTLEDVKTYLNPLVSFAYEPGSTMKIFSFLAAMDNNMYDGNDTYKSGTIQVDNALIQDFNGVGWGTITYNTGFSYSSNVAATKLGLKLGNERLRNFYKKAGFGVKTGIELPNESAGKIAFKYRSELANASFGQGVMVTPIQLLQGLTIMANDGDMIKPYIVDKIVDEKGKVTYEGKRTVVRNVVSKANALYMRDMMRDVVYSNLTDARYYKANNITVIGKTGTAQIASNGGYLTGKYNFIRSFAGLFPYEDPEYAIYIATKQFVGPISVVAKNTATAIEEIAKYKDIVEVESSVDKTKVIKLDNYINTDVQKTVENLNNLGLKPIVIGDGNNVINQSPLKETKVLKGNKVFILTDYKGLKMPNMRGWTSSDVIGYCGLLGIRYNLNGYGKVIATSIEANTDIDINAELNVELGF